MLTSCPTLLAAVLILCSQHPVTVLAKTQHQPLNGAVLPLATSAQEAVSESNSTRDGFPCVADALIAPCKCELLQFENSKIRLDCSNVQSEEQFASVFQQPWPVKELHELYMRGNSGLKVLRNVLNGITFESINIYFFPNVLESISDYFLLDCKSTLLDLRLENSLLTSDLFPFTTFSQMEKFRSIRIIGSSLVWIPPLLGPELTEVAVRDGLTTIIQSGTFPIYAGATVIDLGNNAINTVQPESFTFYNKASVDIEMDITFSFGYNQLVSLQAGTFPLRNGNMSVYLSYNQISFIEPSTFVLPKSTGSLKLDISLHDNELTTFDEEVFGELLPFMDRVLLYGNPLLCGCDIAWLVLDAEKMDKIDDFASCANGDLLHDLNPADYGAVC